jgi:hypothetical protein
MRITRARAIALGLSAAGVAGAATAAPIVRWTTSIQPYAISLSAEYDILPILSVGDHVPVTGDPSRHYQMVGIPDGLGAHLNRRGEVVIHMSHELTQGTKSEPYVGETLTRGAFVSKLIVGTDGVVRSAKRAYDTVFLDDTFIGPAADESNATPAFARFCSGSLASAAEGFDQPIYFANEESSGNATFDGRGGLTVAIFDGEAHALTWLGRFPWENALVRPDTGDFTVVMSMEDGPADLDPARDNSQLWMYVGVKDRTPGATTLQRNGLVGGKLYVFRSLDLALNSEATFESGTLEGEWVEIPGANLMSDVELEAAADAAKAMVFARPEDGAFNPRNARNYFWVTTGGAKGENELGRLYSMRLAKNHPAGHALLSVVYNADAIFAAGGDIALSPDNIACSGDYLMVCEDGTTESRIAMSSRRRDGSIWRFALTGTLGVDPLSAERVVELDPPGRDGVAVGAGVWEASGIIDSATLFGAGSFLVDIQAHKPTGAPAPNTVEDGQLLIMLKK